MILHLFHFTLTITRNDNRAFQCKKALETLRVEKAMEKNSELFHQTLINPYYID